MALNMFDQLSVGIVLLDRFARLVFANAAARALSLAQLVRRGLALFMNDTKWLELQRTVPEELPLATAYQHKDVAIGNV